MAGSSGQRHDAWMASSALPPLRTANGGGDDLAALADHLGAGDTNGPLAITRRLARELPDATLHISDSSGHDVGHDHSDEIMSVIAAYVSSPRRDGCGLPGAPDGP
jgi:hypothetical protein